MFISSHDMSLTALPVGIAVLVVFLLIFWRKQREPAYLFCVVVFGAYILFALDKAFFPIVIDDRIAQASTIDSWRRSVNLIPFNFNFSFIPHIVLFQIILNILLTVPFGFGLNFIASIRAKNFLGLSLVVGFAIESIQLIIGLLLKYPYRIIDVNDAILNALGVLIGYSTFRVFAHLYLWMTRRLGIRHRGMSAYMYEVASRGNI